MRWRPMSINRSHYILSAFAYFRDLEIIRIRHLPPQWI